jgi:hypothetical protein
MSITQLESSRDVRSDTWVRWPGRACCCTAQPAVSVLLPPTAGRDHDVELFLCGHHYRGSRVALDRARAIVTVRDASVVAW